MCALNWHVCAPHYEHVGRLRMYVFMFNGPASFTEITMRVLCSSGEIVGVMRAAKGRMW